jgi:hypothetical protein
MRRLGIRVAVGTFVATAILLGLVVAFPGERRVLVGVYELVVGAMALAALVSSVGALRPERWVRSPLDRRVEKSESPAPVDELERIDRLVVLGCSNAFDLHYRLRPLLRDLAAERLHAGYGVELDREPERARPLLGEELWDVVRPGRELGHRSGPGLPFAELAPLVRRLEEL